MRITKYTLRVKKLRDLRYLFKKNIYKFNTYLFDIKENKFYFHTHIDENRLKRLKERVDIKILSKEDNYLIREYINFRKDINLSYEFVFGLLNKGYKCFLATLSSDNTQIIGATWIGFNNFFLGNKLLLYFLLKSDQAYMFHSFVRKDYRGKGIMWILIEYVILFARKEGYRYIFSSVYENNRNMERLYYRLDSEIYAKMIIYDKLFMKICTIIRMDNKDRRLLSLRFARSEIMNI